MQSNPKKVLARIEAELDLFEKIDPKFLRSNQWIFRLVEICQDEDMRVLSAYITAEKIGAIVLSDRCPVCGSPFIMVPKQGIPYCWECVADNEQAQTGKALLARIKMKASGVCLRKETVLEVPKDWRMSSL